MLEGLDLDDLAAIAETLTAGLGPHFWMWGTADIFYCPACFISFEFGVDPVPNGPREPDPEVDFAGCRREQTDLEPLDHQDADDVEF